MGRAEMKKRIKVHPLMSEAFLIWLTKIGYRGVSGIEGISFYCSVANNYFPRNVMIFSTGRMNKPAIKLFEEFKKYDPFNEVA